MASEWRCASCGHLNSGPVRGFQFSERLDGGRGVTNTTTCVVCGRSRQIDWRGPRSGLLAKLFHRPAHVTCFRCGSEIRREQPIDDRHGIQCRGCGIVYCGTCFRSEPLEHGDYGTRRCACGSEFNFIGRPIEVK